MARKPSVRYWESRGTWIDAEGNTNTGAFWTTRNGRQIQLAAGPDDSPHGPTYLKAMLAFRDLNAIENAHLAGDGNSCRVVIDKYLQVCKGRDAPRTFRGKTRDLAAFCRSDMGDRTVGQVTPFLIQEWLDDMRRPRPVRRARADGTAWQRSCAWGDSAVRRAVGNLHAAFAWAVSQRLISTNPIRGVKRPPARSRGRGCLVGPELHRAILGGAKPELRDLCVCLESTGCRPGELLMAQAKDWQARLGALVFYADGRRHADESRHKTAGKGKDRRIYFSGEALEILRRRVRLYPRGPLWPSRAGKARLIESVDRDFSKLAKRLQIPGLTPYSYRHTYATRWLEAGRSIDDLAALLGNSAAVIRHHYAHLLDNVDRMRDLAEGFNAARTETPPDVLPFGEAAG